MEIILVAILQFHNQINQRHADLNFLILSEEQRQ